MHQLSNTNWSLICLNMEVELTFDAVNSYNFARKRQAAPESCSETQSKKRPCLEDCCWSLDKACNEGSENRSLSCTMPMVLTHQRPDNNCPSSSDPYTTSFTGHSYKDINCNILNQENQSQEMDISCDTTTTTTTSRALHQQTFSVPPIIAQYYSSSASCFRCLRGEAGHMNHLTSWSAVLWAFCLLWYWHEHKLEGFLYINIFSFSHLSDLAVWYYSLQDNFTVNKTQMSMTELNIHMFILWHVWWSLCLLWHDVIYKKWSLLSKIDHCYLKMDISFQNGMLVI